MDTKKKIAIASIITGFTVLATSLSTIAWYNGSSSLTISNFNITLADKSQTLQLSTDNIDFKSTLTNDDLMKVDYFRPVSSMFSSVWLNEKSSAPVFKKSFGLSDPDGTSYVSSKDYPDASKGFFSQVIYVKSDTGGYLSIDPDSKQSYFLANESANDAIATKLESKYPEKSHEFIVNHLNDVVKALRLSILVLNDDGETDMPDYNYYIVDPYKDKATLLGGRLDNNGDGYYDYSVSEKKEILFGECSDADENLAYASEVPAASNAELTYSVFDAVTAAEVHALDVDASISNGLKIAEEQSLALSEVSSIAIPLEPNVSKRIVLSLYLEGWDLDNNDLNMDSAFATKIGFKLLGTSR